MTSSNSRGPRLLQRTVRLNPGLEKSLAAYGAAAAAGVSLLATVTPADARIVYTPAHIEFGTSYPLDLNHDGVVDFSFHRTTSSHGGPGLLLSAQGNNQAWGLGGTTQSAPRFASALPAGQKVGPNNAYFRKNSDRRSIMATAGGISATQTFTAGQWLYAKNRYLGLKFSIHGEIHYGWARLDVPFVRSAVLTGYAYETIAHKPVITGKTKGPDVVTLDSATLGQLAVGASQLAAWRSTQRK